MNIKVNGILLLACFSPLALSGCSSSTTEAERAFTSFDKIATNGITKNKIVGAGRSSENDATVSTANPAVTAYVTVDGDAVKAVDLVIGSVTRSWGDADMRTVAPGDKVAEASVTEGTVTRGLLVGIPEENSFNYQTFGAWYDDDTAAAPTGSLGGFSVGRKTTTDEWAVHPDAAQTSIRFTGTAAGYLYNGTIYRPLTADAELVADFANASADFNTSNTAGMAGAADYNIVATGLEIANGGFSSVPASVVRTDHADSDDQLIGQISGSFYGSQAQEAGGSFWLKGKTGEANEDLIYSGGFGVKK